MRLKYMLENVECVKENLAKNNVLYGTIDTWIIHKLTKGSVSIENNFISYLFLNIVYNLKHKLFS